MPDDIELYLSSIHALRCGETERVRNTFVSTKKDIDADQIRERENLSKIAKAVVSVSSRLKIGFFDNPNLLEPLLNVVRTCVNKGASLGDTEKTYISRQMSAALDYIEGIQEQIPCVVLNDETCVLALSGDILAKLASSSRREAGAIFKTMRTVERHLGTLINEKKYEHAMCNLANAKARFADHRYNLGKIAGLSERENPNESFGQKGGPKEAPAPRGQAMDGRLIGSAPASKALTT